MHQSQNISCHHCPVSTTSTAIANTIAIAVHSVTLLSEMCCLFAGGSVQAIVPSPLSDQVTIRHAIVKNRVIGLTNPQFVQHPGL